MASASCARSASVNGTGLRWPASQRTVTTRACAALTAVHDRMPVMLPREAERYWLDHEAEEGELQALLAPLEDVQLRAVSTAVNDARYDGPECLEAAAPPLTLF